MVREFYVYTNEHQDLKVYVRGKWICFDWTTITQYYGLPDIDEDDFFGLRDVGTIDLTDVIRELAYPAVTWKWSGSDVTNF